MSEGNPRDRIYKTEAIVLSRLDFKEADRIYTIYSQNLGRMRVIAKGARKPSSQLGPQLELFNRVMLGLARGRDIDTVTAAEAVETRPRMRGSVEMYAAASHIVEVLNALAADHQANPAAYQSLTRSLRQLADGIDAFLVCRNFDFIALTLFGFKPELFQCVNCRVALQSEVNYLGTESGGMLCPRCRSADPRPMAVSVNAQKVLRTLDRSGFGGAAQLEIPQGVREEVQKLLTDYLSTVIGKELKSLQVLEAIQPYRP